MLAAGEFFVLPYLGFVQNVLRRIRTMILGSLFLFVATNLAVFGELGGKFWWQLVTFGAGPLLGLLTTLFPSLTEFISSWMQPTSQFLK